MKLHLPISFRKALMACLAAVITPAFTFASGASAAEPAANAPDAFKWEVDEETSRLKLVDTTKDDTLATIVYNSEKDAEGRNLVHRAGLTTFGDDAEGVKYVSFAWSWDVYTDDDVIYVTTTDTERVKSIQERKWALREGVGNDISIEYGYDLANAAAGRITVAKGAEHETVSELFEEIKNDQTQTVKITTIGEPFLADGGAISNQGVLASIEAANFINTAAISHIEVEGAVENTVSITNTAAGGAIYNSGTITGQITAGFVGSLAQSDTILLGQTWPAGDKNVVIRTYAKGGAIYNEGTIGGDVTGDFINNGASAEYISLQGGNIDGVFVEIKIGSMGGAIYNVGSMGAISGNFIGNFAKSELSMATHGQASYSLMKGDGITPYVMGGAIYNGLHEADLAGDAVRYTIGDITGSFVGNYAYNYFFHSVDDNRMTYMQVPSYAMGGAIYNGISSSANPAGEVEMKVGDISGTFVDNYAYNLDPYVYQDGTQIGSKYVYVMERAMGGAIYNGIVDMDGGEKNSSLIQSIQGNFVGNYAHAKSYRARSREMTEYSSLFTAAMGGAFYNGMDSIEKASGELTASVEKDISASFTGNYAYVKRILGLTQDKTKDIFVETGNPFTAETFYVMGGAIHNGINSIDSLTGTITTSIKGSISGAFNENYALVDANSYSSTAIASGGAIHNGITDLSDNTGTVEISIGSINGPSFTGNYAKVSLGAPMKMTNPNQDSRAMGGAIYNGLKGISISEGELNVSIGDIDASFIDNYVLTEHVNNDAGTQAYTALGGALYNGIDDVSVGDKSLKLSATIGNIGKEGAGRSFSNNHATHESNRAGVGAVLYAAGGAIYNGIGTTQNLTVPETIYTGIGDIYADFINNYAGIGEAAANEVAQRALGGAIYNGIVAIDAIGSDINNKSDGSPKANVLDYNRWKEDRNPPGYVNDYVESGIFTNTGNFISDIDGTLLDENSVLSEASRSILAKDWKRSIKNSFVHGAIDDSPGISSYIESITGNFEKNIAVGEKEAQGGAIYNILAGVRGSSSNISNTLEIQMTESPNIAAAGIEVEFRRDIPAEYKAPVEIINSVRNEGGFMIVSIGSIHGNFEHNAAKTTGVLYTEAKGGAISNGLSELLAGSVTQTNKLYTINYYGPRFAASANNSSITFNDKLDLLFILDNRFEAEIANIQKGEIKASIGDIEGKFAHNYAESKDTAKGGAIHNSLGSIAGGSGIIVNTNGSGSTDYTKATVYYWPSISASIENPKISYKDHIIKEHVIDNQIKVFFNNGDDLQQDGGIIHVEIGNISANFESNYVEGKTALGGAIINNIGKIGGGIGSIQNNNYMYYSYWSWNAKSPTEALLYEGDNEITNKIQNHYQAGISNIRGEIKSTIGDIQGNFVSNHAGMEKTDIANGGAIHNGLGEISGGSVDVRNSNMLGYYFYVPASSTSTNISPEIVEGGAKFTGQNTNTAIIINDIDVAIDNRSGKILSTIGDITGDFKDNYAQGKSANGGAIYNSIEKLSAASITISNSNSIKEVDERLKKNGYCDPTNSFTIKNIIQAGFNNQGGIIESHIGDITGSVFEGNYAEGETNARGGAIYNGLGKLLGTSIIYVSGEELSAANDEIKGEFDNSHNGKILVSIGDISSDFNGNYAESTADEVEDGATYDVEGGAIYNGFGSIGHEGGKVEINNSNGGVLAVEIGDITGDFNENYAASKKGNAYGGAIYNGIGSVSGDVRIDNSDGGVMGVSIGDITGNFVGNEARSEEGEAKGGAIYNTGKVGQISSANDTLKRDPEGGFLGNSATTSGGAIYNEEGGEIAGIRDMDFVGNKAAEKGTALANFGRIGEIANDATGAREYDNTIVNGIYNASFTGNTAGDDLPEVAAADTAALYTESDLAIVATAGNVKEFKGNTVDKSGLERDIYMAQGAQQLYMIAEQDARISTYGEIDGADEYVLRLRGYAERAAGGTEATHGSAEKGDKVFGVIDLEGLVKRANVIADDVTLMLGSDPQRAIDKTLEPVQVAEDATERRKDGHMLHPGEVDFEGSSGLVTGTEGASERGYSDVLRNSRLEVRSGLVRPSDMTQAANFNIGEIVSYGRESYNVAGAGYYTDTKEVYATWGVAIDLNEQRATTYTTWVTEDGKANSRGYLTLTAPTIIAEYSQDAHIPAPDPNATLDAYFDVTVQVINLIKLDADGKEVDMSAEWKEEEGDITTSAPLQLDLSKLEVKSEAAAYMDSEDILAEGIGYATTKTYHDSFRIWGWRDNLAAWAELTLKGRMVGDPDAYAKQFKIIGTHQLTRNVQRQNGRLLQEDTLQIVGESRETSTLDVNDKNMLKEVAAGQTLELKDVSIKNVGRQRIENEGKLIMDTLHVEDALTVQNDSAVYKRGDWGIANTFTSTQRSADSKLPGKGDYTAPLRVGQQSAGQASTGITNELHLQEGKTLIEGTVEYQNIYHEEGAQTGLTVHTSADNDVRGIFAAATDATEAFKSFYGNSLTMQGGDLYLNNLNSAELKLRELSIQGGTIHINSVTVNLAASDAEGSMGRIWAYDNAEYTGAGKIIVEGANGSGLKLIRDEGKGQLVSGDPHHYSGQQHYVIPVQFVNPEVAAAVVPFGEENDYAEGTDKKYSTTRYREAAIYTYSVDYDYETGVYTFRRPLKTNDPDFTPDSLVGPVAQAAGAVASMMHLNQYVFEHADLFSANMYRAQRERLYERSYTPVTPMKGKGGKNAVPGVKPRPTASCSHRAGFKGGMWVRPYSSYEKLPLHRGPKVTNQLYGALVGGDTAVTEYRNGWASVFSAHAAYLGSTQRYSGRLSSARIHQNGGAVGATETLYRKNFYTALTATIGTSTGHATTSAGSENFHMLLGGIASRTGYNIELAKGKYVLQPTLLFAYTMVDSRSYTNASGARISSEPLHSFRVHPYVKFLMNTDSCWQPYATAGYVHHFGGRTKFHANEERLPGMSIDPYVEYGLGVQRTWADKYTIFGEVTGRNGGRNGVEVSAGLRYAW